MKTDDFDYCLPPELIAQTPLIKRDDSRMLVVNRAQRSMKDEYFYNIKKYFSPGDCLVLNDSKVFPARIYGVKADTGANIEFLLHKHIGEKCWEVMARPGKRLKIGTKVIFSDELTANVVAKKEDGLIDVEFSYEGNIFDILNRIGNTPLPPYIKKTLEDPEMYQTVYAQNVGSAAAPTAGFHFTEKLLEEIKQMGVKLVFVTLHVGLGTFLPVSSDEITEHKMHSEVYSISKEAAETINETKARGKKVICCGTTSVRTLESSASFNDGTIVAESRSTDIFIYPGYNFKVTDMLITNFHLPKSTLMMLVSAFYDLEGIREVYSHAVENRYRFFSFGDACLFI